MDDRIVELVRKIFDEAIDSADNANYFAFCAARDIFEYALAGNYETLLQYYSLLKEEK